MTIDFTKKLGHRDKIAAARGLARKRMPYFSSALFALMPRPMSDMFDKVGAAMGVTPRGIMYYDPKVVEEDWDLEDCEFGILHEVGHFLRDHSKRCEEYGYDPKMWNQAGDAAINDDLVAAGCKALATDVVPKKILHPKTQKPMADGLTEEAYYDAIRQMKKPPGGGGGSKGKDGAARPGCGNCGGVAGNPIDGLDEDGSHSKATKGRSQVDIERIKKGTAEAIQQHVKQHGCGSVPGGWQVWGDNQLTPPTIRWQDKLRRAVRAGVAKVKGMVNFHYARPSRRQWAIGYGRGRPILPSMYAPLPRVGAFVDTSGSMGPDDLQVAMSEMQGVLKSSGAEVLLGVCDAQMHGKIEAVKDIREACKRLKGGGGTNFVPVYEELAKMPKEKRPHVIVFLTDGGGPAPAKNPLPEIHTIWVLVGGHAEVPWCASDDGSWNYDSDNRIKWGEQIFVKAPNAGSGGR